MSSSFELGNFIICDKHRAGFQNCRVEYSDNCKIKNPSSGAAGWINAS